MPKDIGSQQPVAASRNRSPARPGRALLVLTALLTCALSVTARSAEECASCHEDSSLTAGDGHSVTVDIKGLSASVHKDSSCTDCHTQPGNFADSPHFSAYRRVDCAQCHAAAAQTFSSSFHAAALARGSAKAPTCVSCHATDKDPHRLQTLSPRTAEHTCRQCHPAEAAKYDTSVHAATTKGANLSPGCTSCHPTHSKAFPPSAGAVNRLCEKCHPQAMADMSRGPHMAAQATLAGVMSCASCHDVHATHKPHRDETTLAACQSCHPKVREQFVGSVHEGQFTSGKMSCLSCHRTHQVKDASETESFGCGACHNAEEQAYRQSAHRLARLRGDTVAARCGDCHSGHHVAAVKDPDSPVNHKQIPKTCGKCHTDKEVVTSDYVRLPISLPRYMESVHGVAWQSGKATAVCTDCHGTHDLQGSESTASSIHKENLARTCGKCHGAQSREYLSSVHGRAVTHGIHDSPSCTNCHEEHRIRPPSDIRSPVNRANLSTVTCAKCHQNAEMAAKYGLPPDVIESYEDSYHGWAIKRGGKEVAVCIDCHNTHAIGSALDPTSSINKANVVATCGRCHEQSSAAFAASYTHVLAHGRRMAHDWVRLFYLWLIALVLGGMLAHNLVIYGHELRRHYRETEREPAVRRMTRADIFQHWVLLITFFGLALSGFALRFADSWWAHALTDIGVTEEFRRYFHRIMAVAMVAAAFLHIFMLLLTRRGRMFTRQMRPGPRDIVDAWKNIRFYMGLHPEKPMFSTFDYTQKAEYLALVWGTAVMAVTGMILWFPSRATDFLPAWVVRVSEVVHFYEAILAVSAIFIWHLFFVIFRREVYPMSWTFVNGRMPLSEWEHHHGRAAGELKRADQPEPLPGIEKPEK